MNKWALFGAGAAILVATASYVAQFFFNLKYEISANTANWGEFGDYFGGILNPILSFLAMTLLIKSLRLQNEANTSLTQELKNNEKAEKIRTFGVLFFNVIDAQKSQLKELSVDLGWKKSTAPITGPGSILLIEKDVEFLRQFDATDEEISQYLCNIDHLDHIFSLLRSFYVAVKLVMEHLSDANGFTPSDRRKYYLSLINLTDFAHIRLIIMGIQFVKCHYSINLANNDEFLEVLSSVKLGIDLY